MTLERDAAIHHRNLTQKTFGFWLFASMVRIQEIIPLRIEVSNVYGFKVSDFRGYNREKLFQR
jgi:hypothetical protein